MSDITDGIGGAIEGVLAGRAVEPDHGADPSHSGRTGKNGDGCLNCGAAIAGSYCANCGQKTKIHRTLTAIGHDLIHGVLHLDGKLTKTLPLLAFKPGKLTRRYVDGERARFVSPMSMFLFGVFAMFAVFQVLNITTPSDFDLGTQDGALLAEGKAEVERLKQQVEALPENSAERRERQQQLEIVQALVAAGGGGPIEAPEGGQAAGDGTLEMNVTGIEAIDEGIVKKWRQNPGLMLYKLQANAYKFSWLLIPLSIPFVWLTFAWRRRFKAYDHAIFVTYSLSFMTLLFIALSAAGAAGIPIPMVLLAGAVIPPLHLYKQLRGAYEIGRFAAFWRLLVLSGSIWIIVLLFLQALLLLGAF